MLGQREPQMLLPAEMPSAVGRLHIEPCSLAEANDLVARWHRHHAPRIGHRFSIAVVDEIGTSHGAAIVGRPVARMTDQRLTCEVTRLVTDGTPHACSMLYGAAARAAKALGYRRIQTFTLAEESGISLRAAGWLREAEIAGGQWRHTGHMARVGPNRTDHPTGAKVRWSRSFNQGDRT